LLNIWASPFGPLALRAEHLSRFICMAEPLARGPYIAPDRTFKKIFRRDGTRAFLLIGLAFLAWIPSSEALLAAIFFGLTGGVFAFRHAHERWSFAERRYPHANSVMRNANSRIRRTGRSRPLLVL
jgi:hypothetical protein